ncbi:MAG: hypothetical protein IPK82_27305 [Polyangiaceae bacterium]|nr:hypothetical protein [Polyangiaceae bacterium]
METQSDWEDVDRAFCRLDQYGVLRATLVAQRKLANLIRNDAQLADARPRVSLATLTLRRREMGLLVAIAWHDDGQYRVYFMDRDLNCSDQAAVGEDRVLEVVRVYFAKLRREEQ